MYDNGCMHAQGLDSLKDVYQSLSPICMITIAPELERALEVCKGLTDLGVIVSVGEEE